MQSLPVNGFDMAYLDVGQGPPLVCVHGSLSDFMISLARRGHAETGVVIPTTDAEAFIRGSAEAGVLRIVQ